MSKGIDVSYFQGNIDWTKVAKDGIEFAIPRIGYGKGTVDSKFKTYVKGALAAGIKIPGAYYFSYALTADDAKKEGEFAAKTCLEAGLPKSTIIFFDLEYDSVNYAKNKGVTIDANLCIAMTTAFCKAVEDAGFSSGVYCNVDYYKNYYLNGKGLPKTSCFWLANWGGKALYNCDFHQTSEKGKVNGISGNVDLDTALIALADTPVEEKPEPKEVTDEIVEAVIAGKYGNGAVRKNKLTKEGYNYEAVKAAVNAKLAEKKKEEAATTPSPAPAEKNEVTAALVLDIIAGKYGNGEDRKLRLTAEGYDYDEAQSKVNDYLRNKPAVAAAKSFDNSLTGKYRVNAVALNCRYVPALLTLNNVEKILYQNEEVQCWGYYSQIGNSKWYLIQQGKLIGWVDGKYLTRV